VQRIVIGIIALTMTVGTLGAYFIIILQNKDASDLTQQQSQATTYPNYPVDATAYKVSGPVSELQKADLKVGDGDEAKAGDTVKVHYKGTFAQTGQKFQSSYDSGEPATLALKTGQGGVMPGWVEGIPGMKVGGQRRLVIPASLAYGAQGYPGSIPPNTDLVFEVELLAVNPKQ
jgi:peptidylprolyl isomerase